MRRYCTKSDSELNKPEHPQEIYAIQWLGNNLRQIYSYGVPVIRRSLENNSLSLLIGPSGQRAYVPVPIQHWIVRYIVQPNALHFDHSECRFRYWAVDPDYFRLQFKPAYPILDVAEMVDVR